jgi:hypothetical protein
MLSGIVKNLTQYSNPPYYAAIRSDVSKADKEQTVKDYSHSLPPTITDIIRSYLYPAFKLIISFFLRFVPVERVISE